jgi:hypothetical protein
MIYLLKLIDKEDLERSLVDVRISK